MRAYARSKQIYEEGLKEPDITKRPRGFNIDKVRDVSWEIAKERLQEFRNKF